MPYLKGYSFSIIGQEELQQRSETRRGIDVKRLGTREHPHSGKQSGQTENMISVEEVAASWGTINYEVTCGIAHRVNRFYS